MCSGDEAASAGGWAVRSQEGSVVQAQGGQVPARRQAGLGDAWAGGPGGNLGDLRVRCCSRVAASFGGRFSKRRKKQAGAPWWLSKVGEGERRAHPGPRRVKSGGCVRPRDRHHLVVAESWCVGTGWAGVRGPSSQSRLTSLAFHFFVVQFSFP